MAQAYSRETNTWRFKSSPRHQISSPSQTTKNHRKHCIFSVILLFSNSFGCLLLSLNVPFVERQWNVSGTQIGCPFRKVITAIIKSPAVHNDDAGHRLPDVVLASQTLATTPTHDSGLIIRCCRVDPHVGASAACCMCRSKSGRRCWVRKNSYITTQYSTSELEDPFKSGKSRLRKKVRRRSGAAGTQTKSGYQLV